MLNLKQIIRKKINGILQENVETFFHFLDFNLHFRHLSFQHLGPNFQTTISFKQQLLKVPNKCFKLFILTFQKLSENF